MELLLSCIIPLIWFQTLFYVSTFRRQRHYVYGLSLCPSIHPSIHLKPEIPSFHLYTVSVCWSICDHFTVLLSVHPDKFPAISQKRHGGNGLKFYMLMYPDHLQNWLDYGHSLLIFLILALLLFSEKGQIWGYLTFPGECMKRMALNFSRWCIMATFGTD